MRLFQRLGWMAVSLVLTAGIAQATIDATLQMQLGNPSGATSDPTNQSHYLIQRPQYSLDYNNSNGEPNWVSWDLTASDVGGTGRSNDFEPDPIIQAIPAFYAVTTDDYNGVGAIDFNRGHMCPSEDRTDVLADNLAVFYMTNIVPQSADNNQGPWELFEDYCRTLASQGNEILITSGPSGFNGSLLPSGKAQIPAYTWKIATVVPVGTGTAIDRINATPTGAAGIRVIAIKIPNISGIKSDPWQNYITTVAQISSDTGLTFFNSPSLNPTIAAGLQAKLADGQVATGLPIISVQPVPASAAVGGSATFSVTASDGGNPPLTYQWFKDDTLISGATAATLTLSNIQAGDAASYSVLLTNTQGSTTSNSAALVVTGLPPSITAQPAPLTVNAGDSAVFSIAAAGSPPLTYQWRKNAVAITGNASATTAVLTLPNAQAADAANYDVMVTNGTSSVDSNAVALTVNAAAPTILTQPVPLTVVAGGTATFNVSAKGTNPLSYQWQFNGTPITGNASAATASLVLTNVQAAAVGSYTVVVSNGVGTAATSTAAALTIGTGFAAGTIMVERIGDGVTALGTAAVPVVMQTYSRDGVLGQTIAFPSASPAPTTAPFDLTDGSTYTADGYPNLSTDGKFVTVPGYNAAAGFAAVGASSTTGTPSALRTIGIISPAGAETTPIESNIYSGGAFRSVVSDGTNYWASGSTGLTYVTAAGAPTALLSGTARLIGIFNGTLYVSAASASFGGGTGVTPGVFQVGTAGTLPTGTATVTQILNTGGSPYDFAFSPDGAWAYVTDDSTTGTGGIEKWHSAGGAWTLQYTLGTGAADIGARGLTVDFSNFNAATGMGAAIVATTAESSANRLIYFASDAGSATAPVTLATAGTDYIYRGVTFAPVLSGPVAPAVATVSPANGSNTSSVLTPITVTFNEPVNVTAGWFAITSAANGPLTVAVSASSDAKTFTFNPPAPFTAGDTISVSILAAGVTDQATGSLHPAADYSFSFSTVAPVAPGIATQPMPQTVTAGTTVTFTVVASGTAPFSYQWQKGGLNLVDGGNVSGSTSATLVLSSVQAGDAASYDVVVSNGVTPAATSNAAALTVNPLPNATYGYAGGTYTQNFDTLPNTGTFTFTTTGPFLLADPAGVDATGMAGWSFANVNGTGTKALFEVDTGSSNTGSVYSYGASGSSNRALGSVASAATVSAFGLTLVNATGKPISQFTVTYTGEQWRYGGGTGTVPNTLAFAYSLTSASIASGTFTPVPALNFVSPINSGTVLALDGTAPANQQAGITSTITGIDWEPNQTLVLRWSDTNDAGADAGIAIDNFSFSTPSAPTITTAPTAQSGNVGGTITLSVAASGAGTLTYQWLLNGAPLNNGGDVSGAQTATLTLTGAQRSDAGSYQVVVTGAGGSTTTTPVTVTVLGFGAGELVVERQGTGSAALTNAATALFLDEFKTSGTGQTPDFTVALPTAASGNNLAVTDSGSATSAGQMTRSTDGRYLTVPGYNDAVGTSGVVSLAASATANQRVVAVVDATGAVNSATASSTAYTGNNLRSVATLDGSAFYAAGTASSAGAAGVQYFATPGVVQTTTNVNSSTPTNLRVAHIFNVNGANVLYYSTGAGTTGVYAFSGLPTTSSASTILLPDPVGGSPYGFAISPDGTVAYVADSSGSSKGGGILKYTQSGGVWTQAYVIPVGGSVGAYGLAADFRTGTIYATTAENSGSNRLIAVVDGGSSASPGTPITLATSPANENFRGVDFAPVSSALPLITAEPQSQTTTAGSTTTFSVATNATSATYQWQKNGAPLTDGGDVSGSTTATLTLNPALSGDAGTYTVVITTASGSITSAGATFNVNAAPPPTLAPATSTTYRLNIPATGPAYVSGVMGDPTDPAATSGIDFTVSDPVTPVSALVMSATSSNPAVVPSSGLAFTGTGATRTLTITPVGVGYATITINVTNNGGVSATPYVISYAASAASGQPSTARFFTGASDGSTDILVGGNYFFIGDDENQALRLYDRTQSGLPVASFDFTSLMGFTDPTQEVDIEASLQIGNRLFWIGSGSNNSSFQNRPNRSIVFETDLTGSGANAILNYVGQFDLRDALIAWDMNNVHGLGANYYGLAASAAAGVDPKTTVGYNVEGAEMAPDGVTAYIGFRAPIVPPNNRAHALVVPITNFGSLFGTTPVAPTFGAPIEFDLGGRGIREIRKNAANQYLIIAGPSGDSTGVAPTDFRLYTWDGVPTDAPQLRSTDLTDLNLTDPGAFEGIADLPATFADNSPVTLLMDSGTVDFYNDGTEAKDLSQTNFQKSRLVAVTLGTVVTAPPVFTTQPTPQSAAVGGSVTLTAAATGTPTPTYQWFDGTAPISGATTATLTLTNLQLSESGNYTVVATNSVTSVTSNVAVVSVTPAPLPTITSNPTSQTVAAGSAVTFSVTATPTGAVTYQWEKNGNTIAGATASQLTLASAQPGDAGNYTVLVTDSAGSVASPVATLTVNVPAGGTPVVISGWDFQNLAVAANSTPASDLGLVAGAASTLGMTNTYGTPGNSTDVSDIYVVTTPDSSDPATTNNTWRVRGTNGWSTLAPIGTQGVQFLVSTSGYQAIQVRFDVGPSSTTAEANLELQYTTDGATWINAPLGYAGSGATVKSNSTSANTVMGSYLSMATINWVNDVTADLSSVAGAANNPNFGIRLVNASTGADAVNGLGAAYNNSSGNWRFDEIQISGVPTAATVAARPVITGPSTATGTVGTALSLAITTGTNAATSFSAAGLPSGVTLNPASGVISGTPSVAGSYTVTLAGTNAAGTGAAAILQLQINPASTSPVITSPPSVTGQAGTAFSYQITASNAPTSFALTSGTLPAGLTLNPSTGVISGTPTQAGQFTVWIAATNAQGQGLSLGLVLNVAVSAATPTITSNGTITAQVGTALNFPVIATHSPTAYSATALPAGLTFDPVGGTITGTPTTPTSSPVSVTLTAANAAGNSSPATLLISVAPAALAPAITSPATAAGQVGTEFSYQVTTTPAATSFTATNLPSGLTIDAGTGIIAGTPNTAGVFAVSLQAAGSSGTGAATTLNLVIAPSAQTPAITSAAGVAGTVGQSVSYTVTASPGPITSYSLAGTLPSGLALNSTTGVISGVPSEPGQTTVSLTVGNSAGSSLPQTIVFSIAPVAGVPVITSASAASGSVGTAFSFTLTATNVSNTTPFDPSVTLDAVNLPPGLSVNPSTGQILGTPTTAGTYVATVVGTNANGQGTPTSLTITIAPAPNAPTITSAAAASAQVGVPFTYQIGATGTPTSYAALNAPAWLTVNSQTGALSGTPTDPGTATVQLAATNGAGTGPATALTLTIAPAANTPVVTSARTATGTVGSSFSYTIAASLTPTSYLATGLPGGLSLTGAAIGGIPTSSGTFTVMISGVNGQGQGAPVALTITIAPSLQFNGAQ